MAAVCALAAVFTLALNGVPGAMAQKAGKDKGGPKAGPKAAPEAPVAAKVDVEKARDDLFGTDVDRATAAATALGTTRAAGALDALLDALAMGLHPTVAAAALDSLSAHKHASSLEVLLHYARHRQPELRARAVAALGLLEDKRAKTAVRTAFSDGDKQVRAAACKSAELAKDKGSVDTLIKLLVKGDEATVTALAAIATPEIARKLGELVGEAPDDLLARTLGLVLLRSDFGKEESYVEVVVIIGKIPGDEAIIALTNFIGATPETPPRLSRRRAQETYEMRLGGGV